MNGKTGKSICIVLLGILAILGIFVLSPIAQSEDLVGTSVAETIGAFITKTATISIKAMKIDIFAYQTIEAYYTGTPTPLPKPANVETAIAGTLEAMKPTATYTDEDREIATAVYEMVMAFLPTATPTPDEAEPLRATIAAFEWSATATAAAKLNQFAPLRETVAALGQSLTRTAAAAGGTEKLTLTAMNATLSALGTAVSAPQQLQANSTEAPPVWNYPDSTAYPTAPIPVVLPGGSPEPSSTSDIPESPPPPPPLPEPNTWVVHVSHDLSGGHWGAVSISPYTLTALVGENMPNTSFDQEKGIVPLAVSAEFSGWSVILTDASSGNVIYDGSSGIWNLDEPIRYDPANPREMNCRMVAQWTAVSPAPPEHESGVWTVHVSHDLKGGTFHDGSLSWPHTVTTPIGQNIDMAAAFQKELLPPKKDSSRFEGWTVLFTDTATGNIIYDGRDSIWNMMIPFAYHPDNPREMNLLMIADWGLPLPVPVDNVWKVHINFELDSGAYWGIFIPDFTITAPIGEDMAPNSLDQAKNPKIFKPGYTFKGWSALFTDMGGNLIYDSQEDVWNLDETFKYYAGNPLEMRCRFLARWKENPDADSQEENGSWRVRIEYYLEGGVWAAMAAAPKELMAPDGQDITLYGLKNLNPPGRAGYRFLGWRIRLIDSIFKVDYFSSGTTLWDLDEPIPYSPHFPKTMIWMMIAQWEAVPEEITEEVIDVIDSEGKIRIPMLRNEPFNFTLDYISP